MTGADVKSLLEPVDQGNKAPFLRNSECLAVAIRHQADSDRILVVPMVVWAGRTRPIFLLVPAESPLNRTG